MLNQYKSQSINKILAEPIQTGSKTLRPQIHKFFILMWDKEELH
jgi:hypothetical protein